MREGGGGGAVRVRARARRGDAPRRCASGRGARAGGRDGAGAKEGGGAVGGGGGRREERSRRRDERWAPPGQRAALGSRCRRL